MTHVGRALRRFWPLSLIIFGLTALLGYVVATAGGPTYSATATLSVSPTPAEPGAIDQIVFEIPAIVEQLGSRSLRRQLSDTLDDGVMDEVDSLTASREGDSGIVEVTASGSDAGAVAEAANAAAVVVLGRYQPSEAGSSTTKGDLVEVAVIDEAVPDTGSGYEHRVSIMLAAAALGALLGGLAAAIAQWWSQARSIEARIRTEIGVPVLAVIPVTRELTGDPIEIAELLQTGPPPLLEAFQTLRSRIAKLLPSTEAVVAVSSWQRREGRTTVAAGLGLTLSAAGAQTVVIDCNLRRPDLAGRLGEPGRNGLAEYAEAGNDGLLHATQHPRLDLVSAGVAHSHPAQVLAVALPAALGAVWQRSPRAVVVLDAPPLGPVLKGAVERAAETSEVVAAAGWVLLVIDASHAELVELAVAVSRLREEGVAIVGAVVNRRPWPSRRWARASTRRRPSPPARVADPPNA